MPRIVPNPPDAPPSMRQPRRQAAARGRVPLAAAPAATRSRPWPGLDAWVGANRATAGRPVGSAEAATWPGSLDRAHPLPAQGGDVGVTPEMLVAPPERGSRLLASSAIDRALPHDAWRSSLVKTAPPARLRKCLQVASASESIGRPGAPDSETLMMQVVIRRPKSSDAEAAAELYLRARHAASPDGLFRRSCTTMTTSGTG
jgi:hypothetical protein